MSGTRQFNDVQQMYEVLDSQISTAINCKKLEEAVVTLTMASMLAGVASEKYAPADRITAEESASMKELGKHLLEKAEAKMDELHCEKKEYKL